MSNLGFPIETMIVFIVLAVGAFFIDMFAHKKDEPIGLKSAALWSLFWIFISVLFGVYLWYHHGQDVASLFFTGYALEKVLSVDNLFVMMAIFSWFKVPENYRHRVLYWGIIGAIVFRLIFVGIGAGLLALSSWVELVFALLVGYSAFAMLKSAMAHEDEEDEIEEDYSNHIAYRLVHKMFPVFPKLYGHNFFLRHADVKKLEQEGHFELDKESSENGFTLAKTEKAKLIATPLFLCLAIIELSDVMFAFDSVPAVIAVSKEPLIVYSAMMFAILGLRTMYFVLEALKRYLVHLEKAVIGLLFFIAIKLGLSASKHIFGVGYDISPSMSLCVVLSFLTVGIIASFIWNDDKK